MTWRTVWYLVRRGPGPWLLLASLLGWALLVLPAPEGSSAISHHSSRPPSVYAGIGAWLAMLLAMVPLVLRSEIAFLWRNNLRRWRWVAILVFLGGYGLPWLALGLVWLYLLAGKPLDGVFLATALLAVLVWQCAPLRQRCLNLCHRLPRLHAFGGEMLVDAARFGLRTGALCCATCGPGMLLAMSLPAFHLEAMLAVMAIATVERYLPTRRPAWHFLGYPASGELRWQPPNSLPPPPAETA